MDKEKIIERVGEENFSSVEERLVSAETIMTQLNITITDLIYTDSIKTLREVNAQAVKEAVDMIQDEYLKFFEENNELPFIDPGVFIDIIIGIHKNSLSAMFTEIVMSSFWENYLETIKSAIIETLEEDLESKSAEEVPNANL